MADYERVLQGKYPAKQHARRVVDQIRAKLPDASGVIYLEGRMTKLIEDNDEPVPFRQRRYFYYLTGVDLPDCHLIYDIPTSKLTLFIPPIDPDSVIWSGLPLTPEEALQKYDIDDVRSTVEVNAALAHAATSEKAQSTVFAIPEQVSDNITFLGFDRKNFAVLKEAIETCRVVKDEYEVASLAKANDISSQAHTAIFRQAKHVKNEQELEAVFLAECTRRGAKKQSYSSIVASGRAAATLHYVKNDAPTTGKLNVLVDAGAEWDLYCADITRTFPISGKWSSESRAIYDIVLRMQADCIAAMRPGVSWDDIHLLAHKIAIEGLLKIGILKGDANEILQSRTSVAFFPHGLGHYLGMDTHDCGGNANYNDADPMFRYLRKRGSLPEGSVITVEPGIYFCAFIIEPYLKDPKHAKYIDAKVLDKFWDVGGVRIEDNVVITKDGTMNLTFAEKDPDKLESIVSSS